MRNYRSSVGKERILAALKQGEILTSRKAAAVGFVSERSARLALCTLHDDEKVIHVVDWTHECDSGPWMALYKFGPGVDAEKPPRLTNREKTARYRANLQKDRERLDRFMDARRTRERTVRPDRFAVALFPWLYDAKSGNAPAQAVR